jgi:hypothetical protein
MNQFFHHSSYPIVTDTLVVIFGIFIQPDLGQSNVVTFKDVNSTAPLVRRSFAEDVTYVATRDDFQCSTTHPRLKSIQNKKIKTNNK